MFKKHLRGFTLIEVIMAMTIAAIVLSIGVPGFQSYINNNRKTTSVNDLVTAFNLARSTSITRRERVTVCKSDDGATCNTGNNSGDWSQGWMMFTNPDADTVLDSGEELLRVHGALPGNISFSGNNNVVNQVSFSPQGLARGSNGTITYCDTHGANSAVALVISIGGQIRRATDSDDDDDRIVDVLGVNVTCPTL